VSKVGRGAVFVGILLAEYEMINDLNVGCANSDIWWIKDVFTQIL